MYQSRSECSSATSHYDSTISFTNSEEDLSNRYVKEREEVCLNSLIHLLSVLRFSLSLSSLLDCTPSLYPTLFELLFGRLPHLHRRPVTKKEKIENIEMVFETIEKIVGVDLSHIDTEDLYEGDMLCVIDAVEVFVNLGRIGEEEKEQIRISVRKLWNSDGWESENDVCREDISFRPSLLTEQVQDFSYPSSRFSMWRGVEFARRQTDEEDESSASSRTVKHDVQAHEQDEEEGVDADDEDDGEEDDETDNEECEKVDEDEEYEADSDNYSEHSSENSKVTIHGRWGYPYWLSSNYGCGFYSDQ
ncbi:4413_t:CDS:2 [Paraglomus occultum]|uniref:4413_t:CDS:1 n=1 Tax=Paraglomus occultum TaxID=144539 RepID=A0A9N9AQF1_9GLOM|nr:4413_t:CDS:2 [Paraglomus occultum]